MILRPATHEDVRQIATIMGDWMAATAYIPPLHSAEEDRRFIAGVVASQDVVVCETDDAVQGYIARDGDMIGQLYLAPSARDQGIGTALLTTMKDRADTLSLWCFQANAGARRFYERHGFTAEKFTDGARNEERVPDILYVWKGTS